MSSVLVPRLAMQAPDSVQLDWALVMVQVGVLAVRGRCMVMCTNCLRTCLRHVNGWCVSTVGDCGLDKPRLAVL
jgi:hypothetical protein